MARAREIDVIDVNRWWDVYVGSRRHGYWHGQIQSHDRLTALRAARLRWPGTRIGFVEAR